MMHLITYMIIALSAVLVIALYVHKSQRDEQNDAVVTKDLFHSQGKGRWLSLSERLFDRADYLWLRDEVHFPALARDLANSRKRLAIRWLVSLRKSFDELISTPEPELDDDGSASPAPGSWRFLYMTIRFYALITYALVVVRIFGPYHRLYPSFGWTRLVGRQDFVRTRFSMANEPKPR